MCKKLTDNFCLCPKIVSKHKCANQTVRANKMARASQTAPTV